MRQFINSFFRKRSLAVAILGMALFVSLTLYRPQEKVVQPATAEPDIITYSLERPGTEKPAATILPKGIKPTDPIYITLPAIGAEGDIVKVGVDQNGSIAAPNTIHQAGWFINSVSPGEKGLSIINGHIDPRTKSAIFERLSELKVGDTFKITLGNAVVQTYVVRATQALPIEKSASVLFSQLPGLSHQLNLITCAGTYDQEHGLFTHRLVVAAELVQ